MTANFGLNRGNYGIFIDIFGDFYEAFLVMLLDFPSLEFCYKSVFTSVTLEWLKNCGFSAAKNSREHGQSVYKKCQFCWRTDSGSTVSLFSS